MPRNRYILPLSYALIHRLGSDLVQFLENHMTSGCTQCKESSYFSEKCSDLKIWKEQYSVLPGTVLDAIYKLLSDHYNTQYDLQYNGKGVRLRDPDTFGNKWFETWVCDHLHLPIFYQFRCGVDNMMFVERFGENIKDLRFRQTVDYLDTSCFSDILKSAWNLKVLELERSHVTDKTLDLVGKYCINIAELYASVENGEEKMTGLTKDGILKLIFSGFNTANSYWCTCCNENVSNQLGEIDLINPCCRTLKVIAFERSPIQYCTRRAPLAGILFNTLFYGDQTAMTENLSMIFSVVQKLKSLGSFVTLDQILGAVESPTGIEEAVHLVMNEGTTEKILKITPNLKHLRLNLDGQETILLQQLKNIKSLRSIHVDLTASNSFQLSGGLLFSKWDNLLSLTLSSAVDKGAFDPLNLNLIIDSLPNLEAFHTLCTESIAWDGCRFFEALQFVSCGTNSYDFIWVHAFSKTVKEAHLNGKMTQNTVATILSADYPEMEHLRIDRIGAFFDFELLTGFIRRTEKLLSFGQFQSKSHSRPHQITMLSEYAVENNLDMSFY